MADPMRKSAEEGEVKGDDSLLALSLGSIYHNPTAALPGGGSPVTRALPAVLLRPVDAMSGAPAPASSASAPALALGLASTVAHGNGDGAIVAARVLTANQVVPLPPLFPSDDNGAVVVHGHGNAAAVQIPVHDIGVTPSPPLFRGVVPSAPPSKKRSAPPKKSLRVTKRRSSAGTASHHATTNNGKSPVAGNGKDDLRGTEPPPPTNGGGLIESAPFPWATGRVAGHPTLAELAERGINVIEGEVRCRRCDFRKTVAFDIQAKFKELYDYIVCNIQSMDDRAPPVWTEPTLPDCDKCGQKNSLRPVIAAEKEKINWMFMLLGQTLGLCTLEQLKHFCAHNRQHRTGAKDRVVYSTYMELCNQLYPNGPFDMESERKNRSLPSA